MRPNWTDELVLGRSGEDPAACEVATSFRADLDGAPLVRDGLRTAPGWQGPAVVGAAHYLGTRHQLGERSEPAPRAWFDLAGPGRTRRVLHEDPATGAGWGP